MTNRPYKTDVCTNTHTHIDMFTHKHIHTHTQKNVYLMGSQGDHTFQKQEWVHCSKDLSALYQENQEEFPDTSYAG